MSIDAHILVVDDEAEVRDLLQEYLIKQDFAVSVAGERARGARGAGSTGRSIW